MLMPGLTMSLSSKQLGLLVIAVKRPGNKPTPLQKAVMEELESFGARCIVATSVEDVERALS